MTLRTQLRPSLWHCLWAVLFFASGAGLFGYTLFHGLAHLTDSLTQVVVPGEAELYLKRGGVYTVFLEEESVVNGKIYSTNRGVQGLACRVTSTQNGSRIEMRKAGTDASYEVNGRSGHSVLAFSVPEDGRYRFACDYDETNRGPEVVVAVGSGAAEAILRTVGGSLASLFGGMGAGGIALAVVLVMRQRDKKQIWQAGQV